MSKEINCKHCQEIINKLKPWQLKAKAEIENKCSEKRRNRGKCSDDYLQYFNYSSHQAICSQCGEMEDILEAGEEMADRCEKCIEDSSRERNRNTINPLCQGCKTYLQELKAQEWEKTKLDCKNKAKYCQHERNGNRSFYDEAKESIIKNGANGKNVPSMDMITTGLCPDHKEKECHFKRNCWGDEEHSSENKKSEEDNDDDSQNPNPKQPKNINIIQLLDQLEKYFVDNNIKLIKRENGKLVIEYNDNKANNALTPQQQEQIINYLTRTNKNELSLKEVRRERERERERAKILSIELRG